MSSVRASPGRAGAARPPGSVRRGLRGAAGGYRLAAASVLVTAVVTAIGVGAPLTLSVLGLMAFGVLHNVLEVRHVLGTFSALLGEVVLTLIGLLVLGIMAARLLGPQGRIGEILVGYAVLGVGVWLGHRAHRSTPRTVVFSLVLAVGLGLSLRHPAMHAVLLVHVHNLVPLAFLWWWAARMPRGPRRAFRGAQLLWAVGVPALVLVGAADRFIGPVPGLVAGFGPGAASVATSVAPPGTDPVMGTRLLVVFAVLQSMHYLVWVVFFPLFGRDSVARVEARWPALTSRRVWAAALLLGALFAVIFWNDYAAGRSWYSVAATFHAYLEFPILLALLLGASGRPGTR